MLIGSYRSFPCVAPTNDSPPLCYNFAYKTVGAEIPYQELNLEQLWEQFNIEHEPTRKGIQKFVADYKATLRKAS